MNKPDDLFADHSVEVPEYVALVIEWDALADELEGEITERITIEPTPVPPLELSPVRVLAAALGALGAIGATWWGIRKLRAA
ncbi:MAG: hypothetical protein ABI867_25285 [Kofleriaceae bacterium]